ncbi:MAG: phytanoyl-CoA dioxygenase [Rhodospirillales bacterium]|jgi:non-haem Fe2+, alpha-ketoglutarate-dependent halogenase|nr:phytanoyl-CoA dioxygenase [Rhodospirillales bacterium]MBT4039257.1 phytanoyl-CoA dioxygenase [Rhodospirillales bacterium]MBT4626915.1 phytanoyl-CoA dioxygenase [Rhodospirillales bacterium]MBT5352493.1 phytanoyl-CoA dioxygenase [Rhodospirillales bacterium]MBT5519473.1 phytanoyl-CoA dioxygenase [Rhodospirillales bacterium]
MPKHLTEAQIQAYKTDGFCSPIDVMSEADALDFRRRLEEVEAEYPGALDASNRNNAHLVLKVIDEITHHPAILDAVEDIIGPDILVFGTVLFIKEPGDPGFVSWHQDGKYMGLVPHDGVTAWLALSPSNQESGCMTMLPGSGHGGIRDHNDTFGENNILTRGQEVDVAQDEGAIDLVLRPGQMSFHDREVVHSSKPNISDDRRIGIVIQSYLPPNVHQVKGEGFVQWARGAPVPAQHTALNRPQSDLDEAGVDERDHVNAAWSEILYDNATQKRDL